MIARPPPWTVHTGDCRDVMASMGANSIDTIITDPPYGLAFMGKEWDRQVPGADYWRAALRVAKPGAMLLAFGGTRTWHHLASVIEAAGWEIRDSLMWLYGSGFPKSLNVAKAGGGESFNGWGTALKPAWEPIILAMKPLDGTFAGNAKRHGVAGLAIDAGRIGAAGGTRKTSPGKRVSVSAYGNGLNGGGSAPIDAGRWPANLLLDEEAAAALDEQSDELSSGTMAPTQTSGPSHFGRGAVGGHVTGQTYGDTGGASRFFYCAKTSRRERGEGNDHPTVKPQALMRYLCRLTKTPTAGVVLDPFAGSGSTLLAALAEGREAIGIELDQHNADIARVRVAAACAERGNTLIVPDPIGVQGNLFAPSEATP